MKAFYSDTFVLPLPDNHRFPMAKYRMLRERLVAEHVVAPEDLSVPDPIAWEDLRLVHDAAYVDAVANGSLTAPAQRRIGFPWSPMMVERSRRSVGATLAAARDAIRSATLSRLRSPGIQASFGEARRSAEGAKSAGSRSVGGPDHLRQGYGGPPKCSAKAERPALHVSANLAGGTHHAFRDHGEGFCVFNDVAVAARVLARDGVIRRAVVVDCDVHQGNGTASIFRDDRAVFTLSFHADKNFPFPKEVSDRDVTFDDGAGDDEYLAALAAHVPDVLDGQQPDLVFYLAGADPYQGDRLGRLKMTIEGLRARDRFVFDACAARGIPVALAMSGGYAWDVNTIVTIHVNTVREACRSGQLVESFS